MAKTQNEEAPVVEAEGPVAVEDFLGIHVVSDSGEVLAAGYNTVEDAQAYIDGQLTPQGLNASVVEA